MSMNCRPVAKMMTGGDLCAEATQKTKGPGRARWRSQDQVQRIVDGLMVWLGDTKAQRQACWPNQPLLFLACAIPCSGCVIVPTCDVACFMIVRNADFSSRHWLKSCFCCAGVRDMPTNCPGRSQASQPPTEKLGLLWGCCCGGGFVCVVVCVVVRGCAC